MPPMVMLERAADGPKHDDEGRGRQKGRGDAADEIDRRFGRDPHVVGDAVFRVLVVAAHEVELVVAAGLQPAVDQSVGQPLCASAAARSCGRRPGRRRSATLTRQDREIDQRQRRGRWRLPSSPARRRCCDSTGSSHRQRARLSRMMTSSATDSSHAMWDLASVQNRLRGVPEAAQQVFAPQLLDVLAVLLLVSASIFLSTSSVLTASAASALACSASVGFDAAWRRRPPLRRRLRRMPPSGLAARPPVCFLAASPSASALSVSAGSIGRSAGTLTCAGGFRRAFGHICPGRLSRSSQFPWADELTRSSRLTTASHGFQLRRSDRVSGRFRHRGGF